MRKHIAYIKNQATFGSRAVALTAWVPIQRVLVWFYNKDVARHVCAYDGVSLLAGGA